MIISFEPLNESHFPLLLKWLETPHVKKWWDQDVAYTLELVKEKYESYVQGYKQIEGVKKPIHGYIIYVDEIPIGYIQIYNAYDFLGARPFLGLPQNLAAFDMFIGEKKSLGQNLGSKILIEFFNLYASQYDYVLATSDSNNIAALKCYEKAGCKRIVQQSDRDEVWMLMDKKCTNTRRFIFTGTPGSGKTSVIQTLEKLGYMTVSESATKVIALEQEKGNMRPWEQPNFVDKIVIEQKAQQMSTQGVLQFYDRAPFCTYALGCYLSKEHNNFTPSSVLLNEITRCLEDSVYQNKVFFFENLGFIEHTDARKISYEEALIFEQIHLEVYKKFNFEVVLVPKMSVEKRCRFILDIVKEDNHL